MTALIQQSSLPAERSASTEVCLPKAAAAGGRLFPTAWSEADAAVRAAVARVPAFALFPSVLFADTPTTTKSTASAAAAADDDGVDASQRLADDADDDGASNTDADDGVGR